jgi:predicted phage baseplate assembly protein
VSDTGVVPIAAPADAELVAEAKVVELVSPVPGQPGRATILFGEPLAIAFDRAATVVLANVAQSTHGDTKDEVLGSGDGSVAFQEFKLKQKPLTFVPAPTAGGAASTLEVEVDSVTWDAAPGLEDLGPRDRRYVTRIADDGTATVEFGDGRQGTRLPSGVENVRASYRVGIGAVGNLAAAQLSLLMTRPLGTRSVTNPLPTSGGADPETRDTARTNAPRTVQTFDRVVTLDDCANLARSFAGIGKSEARWVWEGRRRVILLTIAGNDGAAVGAIPTIRNLAAEIRDKSDGHLAVRILACEARTFDLEAGIFLVDGYDEARVMAEVRARLIAAFSFARRELAQRVSVSEVGASIQAVPGVLAVDLDANGIWFSGEARPTEPVLRSRPGRRGPDGLLPAQLVTINTASGGIVVGRRR